MKNQRVIAITGGIGAGKSVVSAILRVAGYQVYDCDSRAKQLMNTSPAIKQSLTLRFGQSTYKSDGTIDRTKLSATIFNDSESLSFVNSVVHPVVKNDIDKWKKGMTDDKPVFIETAILKESRLDTMVDAVWNVVAPLELRVARVIKRNNATREQVLERIGNQTTELHCPKPVVNIINDGVTALLPQVITALSMA